MNNCLEYAYAIKRFTKVNDEFLEALRIYSDTTPYEIRTDTNEITYWLNNISPLFQLYAFGLYLNGQLIGLALNAYIPYTQIVVDDYLAVLEPYRINTLFLNYMGLIQNFYKDNNFNISYYITEISNKHNGSNINRESLMSLKLLCLDDYVRINALYFEPQLGLHNPESEFEAHLYIKSIDIPNKIQKTTYTELVKSIYYNYYLEWYRPILSNSDIIIYNNNIDTLYNKILSKNNNLDTIQLLKSECEILSQTTNTDSLTVANIPAVIQQKKSNVFLTLIGIIGIPIITIFWFKILIWFGIDIDTVNSLIAAIIPVIITGVFSVIITKHSI